MKQFKFFYLRIACIAVGLSLFSNLAQGQALVHNPQGNEYNLRIDKGMQLQNALQVLEQRFNIVFLYRTDAITSQKVEKAYRLPNNVEEALTLLLKNQGLDYKYLNPKTYGIFQKNDPPPQERVVLEQVSGTVTDANSGETLPGVNVIMKGTATGTSTDGDGNYSLGVPSLQDTLVFSFVGYETAEVPINGRTSIDVGLSAEAIQGEDVVVVGYGEQEKINLTGSVSSVNFEDEAVESRPMRNMSSALSGMVAGLNVNQGSGRPGSGASLNIRGIGSLNAGQDPLIVIDGQVGDLNAVNPNDVASVSVLKDAASASIYGSRASNGVIIITTKSGQDRNGKVIFNYTGNAGISEAANSIDLITNTADYMEMANQVVTNSGLDPRFSQDRIEEWRENSQTDPILYPNTDWWDVLVNPGLLQDHNISASGGYEKISFYSSLGYQEDEGVIIKNGFRNFNFRNNLTYEVNDWLELGNIITGWFGKNEPGTPGAAFNQFALLDPSALPQHPDGRFGTSMIFPGLNNPLRDLSRQQGEKNSERYTGKISANLTPIDGLNITGSYFIDMFNHHEWTALRFFNSWNFQTDNITLAWGDNPLSIENGSSKERREVVDIYANYEESIGNHNFNFLAGYNQEYYRTDSFVAQKTDLLSLDIPVLDAAANVVSANGNTSDFALRAYFGRLSYNFDEKYLLEFNLRADGSSRFSPENRWGIFPSASAGWVISEEGFWNPLKNAVSLLKIRGSYGRLGNNAIGNYAWQSVYNTNNYNFGGEVVNGIAPNAYSNRNITWETTDVLNIGMDMRFLNSLDLSLDYYDKYTHGILARTPIPFVNGGLAAPLTNSAAVRNSGIEGEINYRKNLGDFDLSFGANASYNKNRIEEYKGDFLEPHGVGVWTEGEPIGKYWVREVDHIIQDQSEIDELIAQGWTFNETTPGPGDFLYVDNDNNQRIDENDRVLKGNPIPLFNYGANLSLSYKGIDFYTQLSGVAGWDRYLGDFLFSLVKPPVDVAFPAEFQNSWTEENRDTDIPKIYASDPKNNQVSDYFLRKADYLRVKTIQLGYTLPEQLIEPLELQSFRIYTNLENYFTFTSWPGIDPEVGAMGYPIMKTASIGLNITF